VFQSFGFAPRYAEICLFAGKNSHTVENDRELCAVDVVKYFGRDALFETLGRQLRARYPRDAAGATKRGCSANFVRF
jgi:hypothetical protein